MFFTKKQAWFTTMSISAILGVLGGPAIGICCAVGFFILLTA